MNNILHFTETSFENVLKIWSQHLWPKRLSVIESISYINIDGCIDDSIKNYINSAKFFCIIYNNKTIGVLSHHQTAENTVRLRGLWVSPEFRGKGVGSELIMKSILSASKNATEIWLMSRIVNTVYYKKFGFLDHKYTDMYEYGPHLIMKKTI